MRAPKIEARGLAYMTSAQKKGGRVKKCQQNGDKMIWTDWVKNPVRYLWKPPKPKRSPRAGCAARCGQFEFSGTLLTQVSENASTPQIGWKIKIRIRCWWRVATHTQSVRSGLMMIVNKSYFEGVECHNRRIRFRWGSVKG